MIRHSKGNKKRSDNTREQTRPEQATIEREPKGSGTKGSGTKGSGTKGSGTKGSGNKKLRRGSPLMPLKADQVFKRQQKASENTREQTRPEQATIEREPKGSGTKGSGNKKVRRSLSLMPLKADQAFTRQQKAIRQH